MMRKTAVFAMAAFFIVGFVSLGQSAEVYKIGVLANKGPVKCLEQWQATADYLTEKVEGVSFEIVPMTLEETPKFIGGKNVDFILVNPFLFISMREQFNVKPLVSMLNDIQGHSLSGLGGVIFTSADRADINTLEDIRGKKFVALGKESLGGYQAAVKVFLDNGINPQRDFAEVVFTDFPHEKAVLAVMNGISDAGTVRTDTLERMAAAGEVSLNEVKIIHPVRHEGFPFLVSTALYPEWPFAKLEHVSDELAQKAANALREISKDSKAAKDAKVAGWTDVFDFTPVDELQKFLKIDAYAVAVSPTAVDAGSNSTPK
jgi:twitching motility protein PilJ